PAEAVEDRGLRVGVGLLHQPDPARGGGALPARHPARGAGRLVRILYASSEVAPWAKTGGLADVARAVLLALAERGHDVTVVMLRQPQFGPEPPHKWRTVFTVHNLGYQGLFDTSHWGALDLPPELFRPDGIEFYGRINFLKAGLLFADALTTVSRRYSQEIQT